MIKFFQIALMLVSFVSFVEPASADYLDTVGDPTATSSTSAASAPAADSQKQVAVDTSKLLHCVKNYGKVTLEEVPSPVLPAWFQRVNASATLVPPTLHHAAKQAGCFTLVERGTPGVRLKLKVEVPPPTVSENRGPDVVVGFGVFGPITRMGPPNYRFSEAQVMMTVVDTVSGESVAFVIGNGKADDASLGVALLSVNTPTVLAGEQSKNISMQVVATAFADAFNQLVPFMDKLNAAAPAKK